MKATKPSPSEQTLHRLKSYSHIDKVMTRRELRDKSFRLPDIRDKVISIGAKVK
jgi:hypothetical protein